MWSFGTTMTMPKDSEAAAQSKQASESRSSPPPPPPAQSTPITNSPPNQALQQQQQLPPAARPSIFSQRSLSQLGLFFAGAGFLSLATFITRRSVMRKQKTTIPKWFTPSNRPPTKMQSDNRLIALEALHLATLNVMGFGIMMCGGAAFAFDISSLDDLRWRARKHTRGDPGKTDDELDQEVAEYIAQFLGKYEVQVEKAKEKEKDETEAGKTG
ncbi:hypothetical protein F4808DRAFT_368871 [Astrocystis sublimbata]|nr:hypothetical protein F4808DRAFT_368871 [Astrocystis sublimbata]